MFLVHNAVHSTKKVSLAIQQSPRRCPRSFGASSPSANLRSLAGGTRDTVPWVWRVAAGTSASVYTTNTSVSGRTQTCDVETETGKNQCCMGCGCKGCALLSCRRGVQESPQSLSCPLFNTPWYRPPCSDRNGMKDGFFLQDPDTFLHLIISAAAYRSDAFSSMTCVSDANVSGFFGKL
ncbi:unnamed protein product, partial [Amoebophrya sp. A120]|eukprot:GSA120T00026096001.1